MVRFWLHKIWLNFGSVKSWNLTLLERVLFGLNLVVAILIIWFVAYNLVDQDLVENCWDLYDTEHEAIQECEQ